MASKERGEAVSAGADTFSSSILDITLFRSGEGGVHVCSGGVNARRKVDLRPKDE